jgi:hypothetical protein
MDAALNDQREKLFQSLGVVLMTSNAIREPGYAQTEVDAWTSLDAAYALLSSVGFFQGFGSSGNLWYPSSRMCLNHLQSISGAFVVRTDTGMGQRVKCSECVFAGFRGVSKSRKL